MQLSSTIKHVQLPDRDDSEDDDGELYDDAKLYTDAKLYADATLCSAELPDGNKYGKGVETLAWLSDDVACVFVTTSRQLATRKSIFLPLENIWELQAKIKYEVASLRSRCAASSHVVQFYDSIAKGDDLEIYTEYCRGGCLQRISRNIQRRGGRIGEAVLGRIAYEVLEGLVFLKNQGIIVNDLRPTNILITHKGVVKLGEVGKYHLETMNMPAPKKTYMSPERIKGLQYGQSANTWSLGVVLMELAECAYPFDPREILSALERLVAIVDGETPELSQDVAWSDNLRCFLRVCLRKNPKSRPDPETIMNHAFIKWTLTRRIDMARWIAQVWEWQN